MSSPAVLSAEVTRAPATAGQKVGEGTRWVSRSVQVSVAGGETGAE